MDWDKLTFFSLLWNALNNNLETWKKSYPKISLGYMNYVSSSLAILAEKNISLNS